MQELHSDPASATTASHAGQKRRKGASTPATGANTTPLNTADAQLPADPTQPMSVNEQSATAQQPSSSETADDRNCMMFLGSMILLRYMLQILNLLMMKRLQISHLLQGCG